MAYGTGWTITGLNGEASAAYLESITVNGKPGPTITLTAADVGSVPRSNSNAAIDIPITLTGQPAGIVTGRYLHANRASTSNMHFLNVTELADSFGASATGVAKSSVATYSAVVGMAGGGQIYAANILAHSNPGHTGKVTGLEVNVNIDAAGSTAGNGPGEFLVDPAKQPNCGIAVIGNCSKHLSYLFGANLLNGAMKTYAGVSFHNGTIDGPILDAQVGATHIIRSIGAKSTGLDLSGDTYSSGFAVFMPPGTKVGWNTAPSVGIREAGSNIVHDGTTLCDGILGPLTDNTRSNGTQGLRWTDVFGVQFRPGAGAPIWTSGAGTPEGVVTAPVGSLYTRTDGAAATTLYVKETGAAATGWVAK